MIQRVAYTFVTNNFTIHHQLPHVCASNLTVICYSIINTLHMYIYAYTYRIAQKLYGS